MISLISFRQLLIPLALSKLLTSFSIKSRWKNRDAFDENRMDNIIISIADENENIL